MGDCERETGYQHRTGCWRPKAGLFDAAVMRPFADIPPGMNSFWVLQELFFRKHAPEGRLLELGGARDFSVARQHYAVAASVLQTLIGEFD
jgi:hypothetical protein